MSLFALWRCRKWIGLGLLLAAIVIGYSIHKRSLIQRGYSQCQIEGEKIIKELKKKSANEIINIQNEFEELNRYIDSKDDDGDIMRVSSDAIIRMYEYSGGGD